MAITIHQTYNSQGSAIGSKLVAVCSSTNSGNQGFKYWIEYDFGVPGQDYKLIIAPNSNGMLILQPNELVRSRLRNVSHPNGHPETPIHSFSGDEIGFLEESNEQISGLVRANIYAYESWEIDGVLTKDDSTETTLNITINNAQLSLQAGLNLNYYQYLSDDRAIMSDRLPSTYHWPEAVAAGLTGNCTYIPTYESDFGVISIRQDDGSGVNVNRVRVSILPASGPPVQEEYALTDSTSWINCGLYPANLNASTIVGMPKPQDYPNWKAVFIQAVNYDDSLCGQAVVMFNAERYNLCLNDYNKVRLAWVGRTGGWEYFNFTKDSFVEYATEKKIVERVIGNHEQVSDSVPFAFNTFDESEYITDMKINKFLNASSDWIQNGEREFLKGLFLSKQVHWVQDDGSHIPVIVQSDGYQVKKVYGGQPLFKLDVKVKIAQEQFN